MNMDRTVFCVDAPHVRSYFATAKGWVVEAGPTLRHLREMRTQEAETYCLRRGWKLERHITLPPALEPASHVCPLCRQAVRAAE